MGWRHTRIFTSVACTLSQGVCSTSVVMHWTSCQCHTGASPISIFVPIQDPLYASVPSHFIHWRIIINLRYDIDHLILMWGYTILVHRNYNYTGSLAHHTMNNWYTCKDVLHNEIIKEYDIHGKIDGISSWNRNDMTSNAMNLLTMHDDQFSSP